MIEMVQLHTKLHAMQFVIGENYPATIGMLQPGQELRLFAEQDNRVDPNAISVWAGPYFAEKPKRLEDMEDVKIGYLSRKFAARLRSRLGSKFWKVKASVANLNGQAQGVNIQIDIEKSIRNAT